MLWSPYYKVLAYGFFPPLTGQFDTWLGQLTKLPKITALFTLFIYELQSLQLASKILA